MAGHSKWSNIKERKGAQDAKRGKIFQKLSKEIYQAAKDGGPDSDENAALRQAIENARAQNMPNKNIESAIKRATDSGVGDDYVNVIYEGYGPNGSAVLVDGLTDNANRTSASVKHAFSKNNSNLGQPGSVSYMFERKGYFVIERKGLDASEDDMMLQALEVGASDIEASDEVFEIYSEPSDFAVVRDGLKDEGYSFAEAQLIYFPMTTVSVEGEDKEQLIALIDMLEDDEDINEVFHNAELS